MKKKDLVFIFFSLFFFLKFQGQEAALSESQLIKKSYKFLAEKFYEAEPDSLKSFPYANAYLLKARGENDSLETARAYYILSLINTGDKKLALLDRSISYSYTSRDENLPAISYIHKADHYYEKRDFYSALENYLLAEKYVRNTDNVGLDYFLRGRIGLLKSRYGEDEVALELFKQVFEYYKGKYQNEIEGDYYFPIIFALTDSYFRNNQLDSAAFYAEKGFREAEGNHMYRNYFIFEKGIIEYKRGNYIASIDSINESMPTIIKREDLPNAAYANFILGKSYLDLGLPEKAMGYFQKVDSIYMILKDVHPDLRDAYVHLIDFYKTQNDKNNQLVYVQKLLHVDSTLNRNYRTINNKFRTEYDTPKLLEEKNRLIGNLENNILMASLWMKVLLGGISLLIFVSVFLFFKRKNDLKKFKSLLDKTNSVKGQAVDLDRERKPVKANFILPKEVKETLLEQLSQFEMQQDFLQEKIRVNDLAKKFDTNSKYLSMVINEYRDKNFSQYINDLRIDYVVERLKEDVRFRKYTIKAISEEIGFSNPESFSKAFHKKTKIYPSFFINQLEKNHEKV